MKNPLCFPVILFSIATFSLSSCGTPPLVSGPPVPHRVPFREADFAPALRSGSASITGQIGIRLNDNSMIYGDHISLDLVPVNAYTTEIMERKVLHRENLVPSVPQYEKYVRHAITDSRGNFAFHHLPAGEYFVGSVVNWKDEEDYTDNESHLTEHAVSWWTNHQWAWERVKLGSGQSLRVTVTQ